MSLKKPRKKPSYVSLKRQELEDLNREIKRKGIKRKDIATSLDLDPSTITRTLSGGGIARKALARIYDMLGKPPTLSFVRGYVPEFFGSDPSRAENASASELERALVRARDEKYRGWCGLYDSHANAWGEIVMALPEEKRMEVIKKMDSLVMTYAQPAETPETPETPEIS